MCSKLSVYFVVYTNLIFAFLLLCHLSISNCYSHAFVTIAKLPAFLSVLQLP